MRERSKTIKKLNFITLAVHFIYLYVYTCMYIYVNMCVYTYIYILKSIFVIIFIYLIFMTAEMVWLCANTFFLQDWVYQENCVFYVKYSNKSAAALILSYFLNPVFMVPLDRVTPSKFCHSRL